MLCFLGNPLTWKGSISSIHGVGSKHTKVRCSFVYLFVLWILRAPCPDFPVCWWCLQASLHSAQMWTSYLHSLKVLLTQKLHPDSAVNRQVFRLPFPISQLFGRSCFLSSPYQHLKYRILNQLPSFSLPSFQNKYQSKSSLTTPYLFLFLCRYATHYFENGEMKELSPCLPYMNQNLRITG